MILLAVVLHTLILLSAPVTSHHAVYLLRICEGVPCNDYSENVDLHRQDVTVECRDKNLVVLMVGDIGARQIVDLPYPIMVYAPLTCSITRGQLNEPLYIDYLVKP